MTGSAREVSQQLCDALNLSCGVYFKDTEHLEDISTVASQSLRLSAQLSQAMVLAW